MLRSLLTIACLILTACGAPAAPAATAATVDPVAAGSPTAATASPTPVPLSGEITLYTAGPAGLPARLGRAFEQRTGVKVNVFQGDTGAVLARIEAERARPQADVVVLADWSAALQLSRDGLLLPYLSPAAATIPPAYVDPGRAFAAQGLSGLAIVYNTDRVATPPTDWDDLLTPAYRDRVTMPDPSASGSAYDFLATFLQRRGEAAGWGYFAALKANGLIVPGTNAQALAPVISGSRHALVAAVDHTAFDALSRGEKLGIVYPRSGTAIAPRAMVILRTSANPNAAKAFVDFTLSTEGQALVAESWIAPARRDVPARSPRTNLSEVDRWTTDHAASGARRQAILERFNREIAR